MTTKLLKERYDVLPSGVAPKHIRKFIRDIGGVTPWGEARYRLVLAEAVMLHCGARWHDWPEGAALNDQGGLSFSEDKRTSVQVMRDPIDPSKMVQIESEVPASVGVNNKPVRIVEEMRWIPKYVDIKGWLLQVWYPSSYYSMEHYQITVTGRPDLPLLGEFPAHGEYERQFFYFDEDGSKKETFPTMPGESWMERAIQHHERQMAEKANESPNIEWRMLKTLSEMKAARENYEKSQRDEFDAKVRDRISPIFSNTLEGGRFREMLANQARAKGLIVGHVGN